MNMNPRRNYKIGILHKTISPISHMAGTSGNEAILNRETMLVNGREVNIPILSGNALRHCTLREPSAYYLMVTLELEKKMSLDQWFFMLNGGQLDGSTVSVNLNKIANFQEVFPIYKLIGGTLDQILSGSINIGRGYLVCKETKDKLKDIFDKFDVTNDNLKSSFSFISKYQYTTKNVIRSQGIDYFIEVDELAKAEEYKTNQMIYNGETVMQGSLFMQRVDLKNVSEVEIGAYIHSFYLWQEMGGVIGGMSRIGHGYLRSKLYVSGLKHDFDYYVRLYIDHVNANKDKMKEILNELLPLSIDRKSKEKKTKEPKKTKEVKEKDNDETVENIMFSE
jgi:hypothetical protein